MLKQHSQIFVTLMFLADVVAMGVAWVASYVVRFRLGLLPFKEAAPPPLADYLPLLPLVVGSFALSFLWLKLYRPKRHESFWPELIEIVRCCVVGWFLFVAATYFTLHNPSPANGAPVDPDALVSRQLLFVFLFISPIALLASHGLVRWTLRLVRRRGWNLRRVAIIGTGRLGQHTHETIERNPWTGMHLAYYVAESDDDTQAERAIRGVPVRGVIDRVDQVVREHPVDAIFVALPLEQQGRLREILDRVQDQTVDVRFVPDLVSIFTMHAGISDFDGLPVVSLRESPIYGWNKVAKRAFDLAVAGLSLLVLAAPMLVIALLVKLTSKGPVFYKQVRMGLDARPFHMLKFRSMREDSEEKTGAVWASQDDPRRTPIGRCLRRWSLDELPQLLNVLAGDMSLVGPRPERPEFMEEFQGQIPTFALRHKVKSGVTGWAQVSGLRGNCSLEKRIQYDLYYINNWSLWLDVRILFLTVGAVLTGKNAY